LGINAEVNGRKRTCRLPGKVILSLWQHGILD
jgi:hypothetical protein